MSVLKLANYDNGDLMELLYDLVFYNTTIELSKRCSRGSLAPGWGQTFVSHYLSCFGESWYPKIIEDAGFVNGVPASGKVQRGVKLKDWPIRIYFPMSGFWRF